MCISPPGSTYRVQSPVFGALHPKQAAELTALSQVKANQNDTEDIELSLKKILHTLDMLAPRIDSRSELEILERELCYQLDRASETGNPFLLHEPVKLLKQFKYYTPSDAVFAKLKASLEETHYFEVMEWFQYRH